MNLQYEMVVDLDKETKGTKLVPSLYKDHNLKMSEPSMVLLILVMQYSLVPSLFNYSQTLLYGHPLNIDTSLLRTVCIVHWERKPFHFL